MSEPYPRPWIYDDMLGPPGKRVSRVPRYAVLIAKLPPHELKKLTTGAYAYWRAYTYAHPSDILDDVDVTGLLDDGLKVQLKGRRPGETDGPYRLGWHQKPDPPRTRDFRLFQIRLASDMLGALAFKMFCAGSGQPAYVIKDNVSGFLKDVRKDFLAAGAYLDQDDNPIDGALLSTDWGHLEAMDSHSLKHFIFSANNREEIRWTDITTQAFFAAYWACRWATDKQLAQTRGWIVNALSRQNNEFHEFWSFATDLAEIIDPKTGRQGIDCERWVKLFAPLFAPTAPTRSTEFIYCTWDRMKTWGPEHVDRFLGEFPLLAKEGTTEQKRICAEIIRGLKTIPAGTCYVGADHLANPPNPGKAECVDEFRMHQWPVVNVMYELFDSTHKNYRWEPEDRWEKKDKWRSHPLAGANGRGDEYCPVVNICWYDAWAFAVWCGCRLPTSLESEHATRDGSAERWFCGVEDWHGLKNYAHFGQDQYGGRTVPVGDRKPNRNGLYDVAGNVWEWCSDCHKSDNYSHVLRGGSWGSDMGRCRAAHYDLHNPYWVDNTVGLRLASS